MHPMNEQRKVYVWRPPKRVPGHSPNRHNATQHAEERASIRPGMAVKVHRAAALEHEAARIADASGRSERRLGRYTAGESIESVRTVEISISAVLGCLRDFVN